MPVAFLTAIGYLIRMIRHEQQKLAIGAIQPDGIFIRTKAGERVYLCRDLAVRPLVVRGAIVLGARCAHSLAICQSDQILVPIPCVTEDERDRIQAMLKNLLGMESSDEAFELVAEPRSACVRLLDPGHTG